MEGQTKGKRSCLRSPLPALLPYGSVAAAKWLTLPGPLFPHLESRDPRGPTHLSVMRIEFILVKHLVITQPILWGLLAVNQET